MDRPLPRVPDPLSRVCPVLTLAAAQPQPSALAAADGRPPPGTINTVNCIGMRCGMFHPVGACFATVAADTLLTLASVSMRGVAATQPEEVKS